MNPDPRAPVPAPPWRRYVPLALVAAVVLVISILGALTYLSSQQDFRLGQAATTAGQLPVLWPAPAFSYPAQDGQALTAQALRGQVWIADFFFSQCTTVCPVLTSKLVMLQGQLPQPALRFVSFSVDPAHDTPPVLAKYAADWGADPRWRLLSTDAASLPALCRDFKVTAMATNDPVNPIIHSSLFMLVDAAGQVRGAYSSDDSIALQQLIKDTTELLAALPPPAPAASGVAVASASSLAVPPATTSTAPSPTAGRALYDRFACAGCHANAKLAPPLTGMLAQSAQLTEGPPVPRDDAYLRAAILAPGQQVVVGYLPLMPSYRSQLNDAQLADLVAYLKMIGAPPPFLPGAVPSSTTAAPAAIVIDLVCKMKVRAAPDTPHAEYEGKTYYFCCEGCRDDFLADPKKYLAQP